MSSRTSEGSPESLLQAHAAPVHARTRGRVVLRGGPRSGCWAVRSVALWVRWSFPGGGEHGPQRADLLGGPALAGRVRGELVACDAHSPPPASLACCRKGLAGGTQTLRPGRTREPGGRRPRISRDRGVGAPGPARPETFCGQSQAGPPRRTRALLRPPPAAAQRAPAASRRTHQAGRVTRRGVDAGPCQTWRGSWPGGSTPRVECGDVWAAHGPVQAAPQASGFCSGTGLGH